MMVDKYTMMVWGYILSYSLCVVVAAAICDMSLFLIPISALSGVGLVTAFRYKRLMREK